MQAMWKKLNDWARRAGGLWLLLAVLLFLLIVGLNIYVWFRYCSQADELKYFETRSYDALLAALLIPMLLAAIANVFKVNEKFEAEQKQLEQEIRKQQIEAIRRTNAMWSELFNLSIAVAHFKAGQGHDTVRDLRKKLEQFVNTGDEAFALWNQHFPDISRDDLPLFLPGLNILLNAASSVADAIENQAADAPAQQNCLLLIQDGIQMALHQPIMNIFHLAMAPMDAARKKILEGEISQLRPWAWYFQSLVKDYPPNLASNPASAAPETKDFLDRRKKFQMTYVALVNKAAGIATDDPASPVLPLSLENAPAFYRQCKALYDAPAPNADEYNAYFAAFSSIPAADLGGSRKHIYTSDQLATLAMEFFRQQDVSKLRLGA